MKKLFGLTLIILVGFTLFGCETTEEAIIEDHFDAIYYGNDSILVDDVDYVVGTNPVADYSDDHRELIDTSQLSDDDVITFPSESL